MDFYITGMPRSKTAWLSAYFTFENFRCHHEMIANRGLIGVMTYKSGDQTFEGCSDSGLLNVWQDLSISDKGKWLIIQRDFEECKRSCLAFGISEHNIMRSKSALDLLLVTKEKDPDFMILPFHFTCLDLERACAFLGMRYDHDRSIEMMALNIQMDGREVERLRVKHNL